MIEGMYGWSVESEGVDVGRRWVMGFLVSFVEEGLGGILVIGCDNVIFM